ncbi:15799_t:CDS:1, partial [Acaulospora morrowiae]
MDRLISKKLDKDFSRHEDYDNIKQICSGSSGTISKAIHRKIKKTVILKQVSLNEEFNLVDLLDS